MNVTRLLAVTTLVLFASPLAAVCLSATADGLLIGNVELRPGVFTDIHVTLMGDPDREDCQVTIHGGPYTAETWRPYAEALGPASCVLAIDLPGHGLSSVPTGIVYGELLLDDYVTTVIAVLDALESIDIEPRTIIGHSLGGTVVQMTQQRLIDAGTNLEDAYDISEAILVAPDYPAEVTWAFVDSGAAGPIIQSFIVADPVLGNIMQISADVWPAFFFTNLAGEVVPGSPTPAEIVARGYVAPGEPELAIAQLLGLPPFTARPSIDAGIFNEDEDTRLRVIAYENDGFILLSETPGLYTHLTLDDSLECFIGVYGDDTT
ncbi:MAG: alpha/beta fold hydrolase, partial [Acidobacteriota bacterium]